MRQAFDVCAVTPRPAQKPDTVSYNAFVVSCVKGSELRRAYVVCAGMLCQALELDIVNYNAYASACSHLGVRPGGTRPVPRGRTPGRGGIPPSRSSVISAPVVQRGEYIPAPGRAHSRRSRGHPAGPQALVLSGWGITRPVSRGRAPSLRSII